ncbi:transcriptional regulator, TetR family [Streptomyces sp. DvalAA-14]|uniref:TetR/AcrR family transcriptional regulator n=1 Tax=unclassified Streptomyces TaxID=2593676 RepID=UPI00081BAE41|nr:MULTISPECIES: TetR/AcrR family transcriptional regulator [unclassified Streptomyces]MYS22331.1 TetR family transcriptional regulator [Streptomyces sp. SID4948]SCE14128.1 transcriptional regulator, TetR family [Streptomyces sp. DvalAA-14]
MPVEKRTRRAGGRKRLTVLDTVIEVLADRGYEGTRFADVSAASGTAVSTLQNYFGSREDMLIEALQRSTNQEVEALAELAAAHADPWERLVALIDRSLGNPEPVQRTLLEFWRSAMRDEELREHSVEVNRRYRQPFLAAVQEGCDTGLFRPEHRPSDVVDFLLAILAGLIIPRVLHQGGAAPEDFRSLLLSQLGSALGRRD